MVKLQEISWIVQRLLVKHVPLRLQHRIACGIQAFSLQAFQSINANGRALADNRKTGESRTYRVLHDKRSSDLVMRILMSMLPKQPLLYCSLDHSQFGPFCIAVLAVSVRKGRALPFWVQVNTSGAALMEPLLAALSSLASWIRPDQQVVLVMDRWFCGPKLFDLIAGMNWYFITRAKYDRRVWVPWEERNSIPVGEISQEEARVLYHDRSLRMIRSQWHAGMKQSQPWFLLTNLPSDMASRVQVLHRYEERFEIEETFKDMKWLGRLEWHQIRREDVIRTLLMFIFFGWWLLWATYRRDKDLQRRQRRTHDKHLLSWFRTTWESLYRLVWPDELRFTPLCP